MLELYHIIAEALKGTYTVRIINNFTDLFTSIFPYLLISILINALLRKYFTDFNLFKSHKKETLLILLAGVVGVVSPLPTYLAVPISLTLLGAGIPFSVIATFIISSPLINPGIFILTWSQLGIFIALARLFSAYFMGIAAGFIVKYFNDFSQQQFLSPEVVTIV